MSIFDSFIRCLDTYGSTVRIVNHGETTYGKVFIEPLRYKDKMYLGGEVLPIGYQNRGYYLMISKPDERLSEQGKTVILTSDGAYVIKRSETYSVGDRKIYSWAILTHYQEPREDDYDTD